MVDALEIQGACRNSRGGHRFGERPASLDTHIQPRNRCDQAKKIESGDWFSAARACEAAAHAGASGRPLEHAEIRSALKLLAATTPVVQQVQAGFAELAQKTDALTLSLIRQSEVRAEEFARHFAAQLGIAWRGETADQSRKRLLHLDYKRLLAEADERCMVSEQLSGAAGAGGSAAAATVAAGRSRPVSVLGRRRHGDGGRRPSGRGRICGRNQLSYFSLAMQIASR